VRRAGGGPVDAAAGRLGPAAAGARGLPDARDAGGVPLLPRRLPRVAAGAGRGRAGVPLQVGEARRAGHADPRPAPHAQPRSRGHPGAEAAAALHRCGGRPVAGAGAGAAGRHRPAGRPGRLGAVPGRLPRRAGGGRHRECGAAPRPGRAGVHRPPRLPVSQRVGGVRGPGRAAGRRAAGQHGVPDRPRGPDAQREGAAGPRGADGEGQAHRGRPAAVRPVRPGRPPAVAADGQADLRGRATAGGGDRPERRLAGRRGGDAQGPPAAGRGVAGGVSGRIGAVLSPLTALWAAAALAGPPSLPWEGAPFSDPAAQMAKVAATLPNPFDRDADVEVLLEETSYVFDEAGGRDSTTRVVFRALTRSGAEQWGTVGAEWSPWLEDRPEVKARVISAGGSERAFDPATLAEETGQGPPESFSDRKAVRGPLPGMAPGVVVEELISIKHHRPAVGSSERESFYFGGGTPTLRSRLIIDLPAKLTFRSEVQGSDAKPVVSESGGRRRVTVEMRDLPAQRTPERGMPPEVVPQPRIIFGTAKSWNEVARAYSEVVDKQIGGSKLQAEAKRITAGAKGTKAVADRLLAWLHKSVRYTGVELASAAVVP